MGKKKYNCGIAHGCVCPFSEDIWQEGMARENAQDNCPFNHYEPSDEDGLVNDWCKHLLPERRTACS